MLHKKHVADVHVKHQTPTKWKNKLMNKYIAGKYSKMSMK